MKLTDKKVREAIAFCKATMQWAAMCDDPSQRKDRLIIIGHYKTAISLMQAWLDRGKARKERKK